MASTIQIRVDDDLKNKSDQLFKDLGTDTTSAIRRRDASKTGTIQRIFKKGKLPKCGRCDFRYERKIWIIK